MKSVGPDDYHILISHADGTASVTRFQPSTAGEGSAPISPASRLFVGSRSSSTIIMSSLAVVRASTGTKEALVAFGSGMRPHITKVQYTKDSKTKDGSLKLKSKVKISKPAEEAGAEAKEGDTGKADGVVPQGQEHVLSMRSAPLARYAM